MNINKNKAFIISLHFTAWMIVVMIPLLIVHLYGDGNSQSLNHMYGNMLVYGLLFYVNYLVLTPRLFLNGKRGWYYIISLAFIALFYGFHVFINEVVLFDPERDRQFQEMMRKLGEDPNGPKPPFREFGLFMYIVISLLITGFSLGLGSLNQLMKNERIQKDLEKEKLNSELAFLKSQVSPHFLFNTLNNIYALIAIDTNAAKESVMKLSKLLRYLLYESEHGNVLLSHEINFMTHYIDLMKLRLNSKVNLTIDFPQTFPDREIPPLLFVPFIENAFKHGVSYRELSFIHIAMQVTETSIIFSCENSNFASSHFDDRQGGGIGLRNVQKRLNLLFDSHYQLSIDNKNDVYKVNLVI